MKKKKTQPKGKDGLFVKGPKVLQTTVELLKDTPIKLDRVDWAHPRHSTYHPELVIGLEINDNDLGDAAQRLDDWATAAGGVIAEVQHVYRRGKRFAYGRVQR